MERCHLLAESFMVRERLAGLSIKIGANFGLHCLTFFRLCQAIYDLSPQLGQEETSLHEPPKERLGGKTLELDLSRSHEQLATIVNGSLEGKSPPMGARTTLFLW